MRHENVAGVEARASTAAPGGGDLVQRLDRIPRWPYSRWILVIVGLGFFFGTYNATGIGYVLPAFSSQYHLSTGTASLMITTNFLGFPVGAYLLSICADLWGRRWAFIFATLVYTVGTVASALGFNLIWVSAWQFVVGAGIAAVTILQTILISELAPARVRGRYAGYATATGFCAFFALPLLALVLVPTFAAGWRVLWAIGAVAGALLALWAWRSLPESPRWLLTHGRADEAEAMIRGAEERVRAEGVELPPPSPAPPEQPARGFPTWALFRRPYLFRMLVVLAGWFIFYVGNHGWTSLAPTLLLGRGYTLQKSLLFLVVTNAAYPIGTYVAALISDRWERKITTCVGMLLWAASFALIALVPSPATILIGGTLGTFFMAGVLPLFYVLTAESFPTRARSNGLGLTDGVGHVGAAVAPMLILGIGVAAAAFTGGMLVIVLCAGVTGVLLLLAVCATGKPLQEVSQ